ISHAISSRDRTGRKPRSRYLADSFERLDRPRSQVPRECEQNSRMSFRDQKQLSVQHEYRVGLMVFTVGIGNVEYVRWCGFSVARQRLANTIDDNVVALCSATVARVCDIQTRFISTRSDADVFPIVDVRTGDSNPAQQLTRPTERNHTRGTGIVERPQHVRIATAECQATRFG